MYDLTRSGKKWGFNYGALIFALFVVALILYVLFSGLYNSSKEGTYVVSEETTEEKIEQLERSVIETKESDDSDSATN